jgi:signal recognition particle receptor subunit beta
MGGLFSSLWLRLFGQKEFKICIVGLDNAGKTTCLYQMNMGEVVATKPTIGSNVEEVNFRNVKMVCWDLGGQESLRATWSTYFVGTHAIMMVVDSTDRERIGTVKEELWRILAHKVCWPPRVSRIARCIPILISIALFTLRCRTWKKPLYSFSQTSKTWRIKWALPKSLAS